MWSEFEDRISSYYTVKERRVGERERLNGSSDERLHCMEQGFSYDDLFEMGLTFGDITDLHKHIKGTGSDFQPSLGGQHAFADDIYMHFSFL